jgi:hypothetical protein
MKNTPRKKHSGVPPQLIGILADAGWTFRSSSVNIEA